MGLYLCFILIGILSGFSAWVLFRNSGLSLFGNIFIGLYSSLTAGFLLKLSGFTTSFYGRLLIILIMTWLMLLIVRQLKEPASISENKQIRIRFKVSHVNVKNRAILSSVFFLCKLNQYSPIQQFIAIVSPKKLQPYS